MTDKIEIADLRRLELRPGDRVVLKLAHNLPPEGYQRLRKYWDTFAPDVPVLIIGPDMSLDIIAEAA
jgi:hypothetical protein